MSGRPARRCSAHVLLPMDLGPGACVGAARVPAARVPVDLVLGVRMPAARVPAARVSVARAPVALVSEQLASVDLVPGVPGQVEAGGPFYEPGVAVVTSYISKSD